MSKHNNMNFTTLKSQQLAGSSPFINMTVAVQKVTEDGIVHAIIHLLTL